VNGKKHTIFNPQGLLESYPGVKAQGDKESNDRNTETLRDEIDCVENIRWVVRHDGLKDKGSHHPGELMG
jgi:hypothetical protein